MFEFNGYGFGVRWIAENDEPHENNADIMSGYASVGLLADLTNRSSRKVSEDVIATRQRLGLVE